MAKFFLCLIIQRLILPLILATCLLMKPVGLSLPYLIFLLMIPYVPVANKKTILGHAGLLFKLIFLWAVLVLGSMLVFHLLLISFSIERCSVGEIVLRHIGFVDFNGLGAWMVVYWLAPEVILVCTAAGMLIVLRKLTGVVGPRRRRGRNGVSTADTVEQGANSSVQESCATTTEDEQQSVVVSQERVPFFTKLGIVLSMCMLCVTGVLQPSALSGVYFLVFLGAASWWACYKQLDKAFGIVLKVTLAFLVTHITIFLAYQNPGPQELLPYNETAARVLALKPILSSSCDLLNQTDIRDVHFNSSFDTDVYLNPIFLILCYYCITMTSSLLLRTRSDTEKDKKRHDLSSQLENGIRLQNQISFRMHRKNILRKTLTSDRWRGAARKVKLMRRGTHRIRDASATDGKETAQTDQIALETLESKDPNVHISEEEESSSIFEQALLAVRNVASYIYMNSYIFTNVIMMVWSIMYHSWLTFVLLIWANLIWIMPNHRKNMLNSSPFLVIYAELLLLAQYLYGMNLTEEELPTVIDGSSFNLEQLGFVRRLEYPCVPLLVKSLFTTMFWISLRQQIQEKHTERRESMIANMASPIQLPIGAATTAATGPAGASGDRAQEKKSSAFVTQIAKFFKSFMIKFWIWMVALTLFLSAIIGNRMTMFRIVYMVLFLAFVLTFQFSFKVWRKIMYSFWFTVIGYSMAILVLVYVHQFEQFPRYWAMIGISKELQEDIGLEIFKTGQLFLHLLNPTLVVIITVIQLHYCHERFLVISEIPSISEEESEVSRTEGNTSAYGTFAENQENQASDAGSAETIAKEDEEAKTPPATATIKEEDKDEDGYEKLEDFQFRKLSRQEITSYARKGWKMMLQLIELTWLFFELHMPKIILIVAFSLSVNSVNLLHLLYVVLSVFTVKRHTTGKHSMMHGQLIKITRIMSLFSSLMLILTMIYQVKYIKEENFQSECPNIDTNITQMDMNNAQWFGMRKANGGQTLTDLLRPYLVYILMVTVHTVTILRQTIRRIRLGLSPKTPELMFPNIVRADADKDIPRMIMYLFNYGFFKFGVEISLVALIVTIGQRMDVLSIVYAIWLAVIFHMTRTALQRIWQALTWFIVVSIPLQYLLFIGLPPLACVNYPWMIVQLDHFRIWAMLPENTVEFRSFASKMVADFVLLMFLCRQTVVFRLDLQAPKDYGGGSNASVLEDFQKLDDGVFKNPTPDFITKVRNWLDVLKRTLFLVSFWFTLAIVFLSGSNRVNLFSVGYLIGAFFFLWQGTDFYLHSIDYILKRWNMLIWYNVFVIISKTLLQLFGCLFLDQMMNNACWVMQLFGVTCLSSTIAPLPPSATDQVDQLCRAPDPSDAGLFWDGMCFAFLLLQRRLFSSHYFCHIINESKASKYLASRGAELIEELRVKESTLEAERERQILEKIKAKMDRIKATQQKILEAVQDPGTHGIDTVDHRSSLKRKISEHRPTAIRSGDYYMFEDVEQEFELEMIEDPITNQDNDDLEDKTTRGRRLSRRLTLSRLAAQLKERRRQEVFAISRGIEDGDNQNETGGESVTSGTPSAKGTEQPLLQRRLSSPVVYRRRRSVAGEHSAAAGLDDNAIETERSALSEPIPPPHSLSRPRLRKPTDTDEPDIQQAGPSKDLHAQASITDEEARLLSDDEDEEQRDGRKATPEQEKKGKFSLSGLALIPAFVVGAIGSLTLRLHRVSRNYRYVMRVLSREKQELKETPGFGVGTRDKDGVWTHYVSRTNSSNSDAGSQSGDSSSSLISRPGSPTASSQPHVHSSNANPDHQDALEASIPPSPTSITTQPPSATSGPKQTTFREDLTVQPPNTGVHHAGGFGVALAMISRKDPLKDDKTDGSSTDAIKRTLDEVSSEEDFTTRKHSLIVELLQATWYAIMSHTDFICYFVVFLNQVNYASLLSLPLPLMVTLWGTLTFPRPSQTFWTKLIAYTQTVVLIKCICQFEMLWWNQTPIPSNQPFHPARLFGIERKDGYATYDLILLLMLFCHRFILKSLGLWKSDPTEEPSLKEGLYQVDPNDERSKAIMALAEENENVRDTFEVRKTDNLTGLSMIRINETAGPMPPPLDDPNSDSTQLCVSIQPEPVKKFFPQIVKEAFLQYSSALKAFFSQLLDRQSRKTADVYGYMFLCDFVNFFVILFGFSAFGTQEGDGGVLSYFEENRVPVTFLLMLIIQFFLIVVDRALYLRKNIVGKILFQFFLIIGLHVWMFFVLPATTERSFNATTPPILYYMIKCFYLLFSAYQIRCGYPARILGNFLTKGFTMANFSGFKLFMTVPFLFELRTLMDWIWTDTSMTLFDWLKMEDIFTNVYQLKCMRQLEEDLPAPRGQKKGVMVKYLMGGGMMLGIIFLIWFPLALFAFSNAVGEPNIPYDVSVTLRIGPYEPVYMMSAQDNNIHGLTDDNWGNFTAPYATERTALTFLSNYEPADVAAVKLGANSTSIWNISPPDRERLLNDLKSNVTLTCRFRYTISRRSHSKENPGIVSEEQGYEMGPGSDRDALIKLLTEDSTDVVMLPNLMPKFLRVQNSGTVRPIHQLIKNVNSDTDIGNYRNLKLRLFRSGDNSATMFQWWETREDCSDTLYEKYLSRLPYADCANYLVMYMFNDKIFPSTISSIAAGGIIGIYSTMILVFSRMLRTSIFSGASSKIMFEDLPYVDRVVQLCLDIYLVRESCEFTLEEDLFAKLIFLYRSPETMIKWSRPKNEDGGDDETDTMADVPTSHPKQE
ncbi:piezo-type mechanosensitive ion channel component-like isoform X15 [Anopheles albimanus]|uniref:piezo-type mechanosensitive ion channel component-like isoform X15 n=1 Tax=Anopheles albimanus TaxID=7167 RepID=UPI00163E61B0|nr:piezo-type mechanosensitive ion channel component-like isoform X15 [Anopheles albimanus]